MAGEFSKEALQAGVDEWFEDIWIAVDEVALTMKKDETAAGFGFRMKSQVMKSLPKNIESILFNLHHLIVFVRF